MPCHRSKQDLSHANSVNRDLLGRCLRLTEVLVDFVVDQGQQGGQLQGQLAHLLSEVQDVQHCSLRDALQVGKSIPWWVMGWQAAAAAARRPYDRSALLGAGCTRSQGQRQAKLTAELTGRHPCRCFCLLP
jgi:hypothetical protein